jgi:hypothetical protein
MGPGGLASSGLRNPHIIFHGATHSSSTFLDQFNQDLKHLETSHVFECAQVQVVLRHQPYTCDIKCNWMFTIADVPYFSRKYHMHLNRSSL